MSPQTQTWEASRQGGIADAAGLRRPGRLPIEQSEGDTGIWVPVITTTTTRLVVGGFTPGKQYRLRAAVIGAEGQSPWSNPVEFMAI